MFRLLSVSLVDGVIACLVAKIDICFQGGVLLFLWGNWAENFLNFSCAVLLNQFLPFSYSS